jgi:hypothetical protein
MTERDGGRRMKDEVPEVPSEDEWICTQCGEANPVDFGLCWKCQASAPEPPADGVDPAPGT